MRGMTEADEYAIRYAVNLGRDAEYCKQPPQQIWEDALTALDALVAERDRLREALERIAANSIDAGAKLSARAALTGGGQ